MTRMVSWPSAVIFLAAVTLARPLLIAGLLVLMVELLVGATVVVRTP